jgi:hypothetical protein
MMYKVVRRVDDKLKSAIVHQYNCGMTYEPNQWVFPKIPNSKIYLFTDRNAAIKFTDNNNLVDRGEIWECDASDVAPLREIATFLKMEDFWTDRNKLNRLDIMDSPTGSHGCSAIRLTRRLYPFYKVVDEDLGSARVWEENRRVIYSLTDYVKAPIRTKLFVFDDLESALKFRHDDEKVFRCIVENPSVGRAAMFDSDLLWAEFSDHIADGGTPDNFRPTTRVYETPCHWADEVRLLDLVG